MKYRNASPMPRGFTLIELMVVVVVVAILAAVAIPNYTQYVQRGYRAQAMATLLKHANWMQQQYTVNSSYRQPDGSTLSLPVISDSGTRYAYKINASTSSTFELTATPTPNDKCGTFSLDNTGKRGATGGKAPAASAVDCWAGR
ncbi:type IV pilin protein [Collimonas sp. NPDC087041]|uniref:type IV pilin protein n=1 Tax=Collimonas sp. NPDC087041 TaxID=3363960 RepID=UPI0037F4D7B7